MLPTLLAHWYKSKHRLRRFRRAFSVPSGALTLDIGSGDSPFPPSDVICEKFPWDDSERTARFQHDRPLVVGDIEALPFRDQAFGYIYCSHVLEHTVHPERAIAELMRVGKQGYIEVPTAYFERTAKSYAGHLWFVTNEEGTLVFRPKTQGLIDPESNRIFDEELIDKDPLYTAYHYARLYKLFHIGIEWKGAITFRVEGSLGPLDAFTKGGHSHGEVKAPRKKPLIRAIKKIIRRLGAKKSLNLDALLACPVCHHLLAHTNDGYHCAPCRSNYIVRENIPVLLSQ